MSLPKQWWPLSGLWKYVKCNVWVKKKGSTVYRHAELSSLYCQVHSNNDMHQSFHGASNHINALTTALGCIVMPSTVQATQRCIWLSSFFWRVRRTTAFQVNKSNIANSLLYTYWPIKSSPRFQSSLEDWWDFRNFDVLQQDFEMHCNTLVRGRETTGKHVVKLMSMPKEWWLSICW